MNKQELLESIENMGSETSESYPHDQVVDREVILNLIDQLDEPEKVVIPQFVADWIIQAKKFGYSISDSMEQVGSYFDTNQYDKAMHWARYNQNIFAKAWLDDYKVEKEKLYYIELIKGKRCMAQVAGGACWFPYGRKYVLSGVDKIEFTESEIKAIDERFWPFAVEVAE